ncbi:hypothetical protein HDV02_005418 [Globomyces sp. JEL0801]|nr:hypothetical protein HDV02_005418 [Globomyces sp. JEL0801]
METNYVKQSVGPVLTNALSSLILHYPYSVEPSSYSTTLDPISYVGYYLLAHSNHIKENQELVSMKETSMKAIQLWKDSQIKDKQNRINFDEALIGRINIRKIEVDQQIANSMVEMETVVSNVGTVEKPSEDSVPGIESEQVGDTPNDVESEAEVEADE